MKKSEVRWLDSGDLIFIDGEQHKFVSYSWNGDIVLAEDHNGDLVEYFRKEVDLPSHLDHGEKQRPHADLRAQYEKDAKWHPRPWELWQVRFFGEDVWASIGCEPRWIGSMEYRRKPLIINGIEVPEPVREALEIGQVYHLVDLINEEFVSKNLMWRGSDYEKIRLARGLIYLEEESASSCGRALVSFTREPE